MLQDPSSGRAQSSPGIPGALAVFRWALLAVVLAAPLWHLHVITRVYLPANHSDLLPVWSGTRVAMDGRDPYSANAVLQMQRPWYEGAPRTIIHAEPQEFWYPAQIIVFFAPIASLSWLTLRLLYVAIIPPLAAVIFFVATGFLQPALSVRKRLLVAALALFSWPVVWGVRLQQMSVVVMLLVLLAWYLFDRGQQIVPGVLLAIATIKPQLILPLLAWLLVWTVSRRMWRTIAAFSGALALLLAAAQWILPGWIPHWLTAIGRYRSVTHSSPQLESAFGHWAGLAVGIVVLLGVLIGFVRLRRFPPASAKFNFAAALTLAAAVLVAPFNPPIIYNYVFLLPAVVLILFHKPGNKLAAALRIVLIIQLVLDIFAPAISVLGETLTGTSSVWTVLPFLDFLLPGLATAILLLEIWDVSTSRQNAGDPYSSAREALAR